MFHLIRFYSVLVLTVLAHATVRAENHALIMTIDYASANIQEIRIPPTGIAADARMALEMARLIGVPDHNITQRSNGLLTLQGMRAALSSLTNRIRHGDKVFIYYSGHGLQYLNDSKIGGRCTEALYSADLEFLPDAELEGVVDALTAKAGEVVIMNDSCFAGGGITRGDGKPEDDGAVAKRVELKPKAGLADDPSYSCNKGVNHNAVRRVADQMLKQPKKARLVYLAASADNEVAFAFPTGSMATVAWHQCLKKSSALTGNRMHICAQEHINNMRHTKKRQHITFIGDGDLPLHFGAASPPAQPANATPSANTTPPAAPALPSSPATAPATAKHKQQLESLGLKADPAMQLMLNVEKNRLKINQDLLHFSVQTPQSGYLYLLHIGTDGFLYQLFPNTLDPHNHLPAGRHDFPRPSWGIKALGPAGTGYFMAYLSSTPRNFTRGMTHDGPFHKAAPDEPTMRTLGVVARKGSHGISQIATIEEVN